MSSSNNLQQQEDADLARAIQLSLQDAPSNRTATMVSPPPAVHPSWHTRSDATAADEQYARLLQHEFDREASQATTLFNPHHPTGPCIEPRRIKSPARRNSPPNRAPTPSQRAPTVPPPAVVDARTPTAHQPNPADPPALPPPSGAWWGTNNEQRQQAVLGATAANAPSSSAQRPAPYVDPTAVARGEACAGCHNYFGFMDGLRRVTAMGSSWHASCFVCAHCSLAFQGTFLVGSDGKPYHQHCHTIKFVPTCSICHTHIAADVRWFYIYKTLYINKRYTRCQTLSVNHRLRGEFDGTSIPFGKSATAHDTTPSAAPAATAASACSPTAKSGQP